MAFVDELVLHARAGRGGDGVVRWLHEKGKEYSGPAGGNGGNGGDVYIRGVRDINLLAKYRGNKGFAAEDGNAGEHQNRAGKQGEDITIDLPVGSVVINKTTGEIHELTDEDQTVMVLKGGRGGAGNAAFKSSVNRTPTESTPGQSGEEAELHIELRLFADAGLVGLPNAGKSSLLNALTGASAKVGAYPFTTLDPNLGVLYGFVLADIPGLIEGASAGKGLGTKFLRHIARTRLLVHCVPLDAEDPMTNYMTVRKEIESWGGGSLLTKPEVIVLTKSDTQDAARIQQISDAFTALDKEVTVVSALDDTQLKALGDFLTKKLHSLHA
ncbi:MAG TPA: GTPase ObgE [Candidatus Paceibacterota bacterium]